MDSSCEWSRGISYIDKENMASHDYLPFNLKVIDQTLTLIEKGIHPNMPILIVRVFS